MACAGSELDHRVEFLAAAGIAAACRQEIAFTAVPAEGVLAAEAQAPDRIEARLAASVRFVSCGGSFRRTEI